MFKYIAIEGLEGAGKSTAIKAIHDFYEGQKTIDVREPGGTPLAERLRDLVKSHSKEEIIDSYTETCLFFAARNQLIINVIEPAIKSGKIVISDRCYLSSIAYQQEEKTFVADLCKNLKFKPNLIVYLDIDPVIGLNRARTRGQLDRIEMNHIDFFNKARESYLDECGKNDFIVKVDASQSIEAVYKDVLKVVSDFELGLKKKATYEKFKNSGLKL